MVTFSFLRVCVGMYGITYSLYRPRRSKCSVYEPLSMSLSSHCRQDRLVTGWLWSTIIPTHNHCNQTHMLGDVVLWMNCIVFMKSNNELLDVPVHKSEKTCLSMYLRAHFYPQLRIIPLLFYPFFSLIHMFFWYLWEWSYVCASLMRYHFPQNCNHL